MDPRYQTLMGTPELLLQINGQDEQPLNVFQEGALRSIYYRYGIVAEGLCQPRGTAVEWQWNLRNEGTEPTPPVSAFRPFVVRLTCRGHLAPRLHGSRGGLDDACFPPVSWSLWNKSIISEGLPNPWVAVSGRGRSANHDLPFFVLEDKGRDGGLFIVLGWSGDWDLRMERQVEEVVIHAGMTHLNLTLMPGESVRQPSVLVGVYHGAVAAGFRALRNTLRDHIQPSHHGQHIPLITCFNNYYGDRGNFNEEVFLREIPAAAEAGIEYLVIDGGWTGGGEDARWDSVPPYIGNWNRPDPKKFPQGFGRVRQAAEQAGRKMGLWFDVEHAHPRSLALAEHPELFFTGLLDNNGCHLLRLDTEAGVEWAFESIAQNLRALGGLYLKFDMNSDPAPIWAHNDLADRRGITEIRYIENLYRLLDKLLEAFPDMLIENCASGGRRIDLEMIRRSHTNWLSDHSQSEAVVRYHIFGASHFLPANQINTGFAHKFLEPNRPADWNAPLPASVYLSMFGGNFFINDRLHELGKSGQAAMQEAVMHFYRTRQAFSGDLTFIGEQGDTYEGISGLAGQDPLTERRAAVIFGASLQEAASRLPEGFTDLAEAGPCWGDMGNEQFAPAYLFYDF